MSISLNNLKQESNELKNLYDLSQDELKLTGILSEHLNKKYIECLTKSSEIIKFCDTLNPFEVNRYKDQIKSTYYISAEVLARTVGLHSNRDNFTDQEKSILYTCIAHIQKVLNIEPFNKEAKELYKIIFIYLTIYNGNAEENIKLLNNVLMVDPSDYQLQYNLGFMYHRINKLEESLQHYKLSVGLIDELLKTNQLEILVGKYEEFIKETSELPTFSVPISKVNLENIKNALEQFKVKCLNGIGGIYFSIQDRELANYYFYQALEIMPDDPDVNNQIGVVYTELRFTDKAIKHYKHGIDNADKAHISTDRNMLLASMYMNMGLAYCYEINYPEAINCYNKALEYKPRLSLAYQNKLLDLNYISHLIEDPMYIAKLHKNINKIYPKVVNNWKESLPNYKVKKFTDKSDILKKSIKINIGFVSGDFICHPVSYFLSCILKYINYDIFNVFCYSLKFVSLADIYPNANFRLVKGSSPEELKNIISLDSIDILFDMSSQTGDNKLDTFVLKPAPIQISYCGYPNTSGLSNMDYHIVDYFTDSDGITKGPAGIIRPSTQKYYTEKLLFMDNCFLSYTPSIGIDNLPLLSSTQPCNTNKYLTIGSFNRYNKLNDNVIEVWEEILEKCPNVQFIIKTKEFLTPKLKTQFLKTWKNQNLLTRIKILDYSDLYQQHLIDYNLMDIALDSFPYSGTTTSCEALMMGVPILTLFDDNRQYHCQNVTSSLMINSGLEEYVVYTKEQYINKIVDLSRNLDKLNCLKQNVRESFIKGPLCNYKVFVEELEDKLVNVYKNHF